MIEVEVRGPLSDEEFDRLRELLRTEGELKESQDREMILLRGYPGYSKDPNERDVDIRLRNTNGSCEIMVKRKSSSNNVGRHEASLPLGCSDLGPAKEALKALGYSEGLWMHRKKEVYQRGDIEWSVVDVPGLRYFEAEMEAKDPQDIDAIQEELANEAKRLGLSVFNPKELAEFIEKLDAQVNKDIAW